MWWNFGNACETVRFQDETSVQHTVKSSSGSTSPRMMSLAGGSSATPVFLGQDERNGVFSGPDESVQHTGLGGSSATPAKQCVFRMRSVCFQDEIRVQHTRRLRKAIIPGRDQCSTHRIFGDACETLSSQDERESSVLTTYWSEFTSSSRLFGGPASRHGSLNSLLQVALYRLS